MVIKLLSLALLLGWVAAHAQPAPAPPAISALQWGLRNRGEPQRVAVDHYTSAQVPAVAGEDIGLPAPLPALPSPVTVAVLDTGIDYTHPLIQGRLAGRGYNFVANTADATDSHGHGTHVAGIILSVTPNARILPVKVVQSGPNAPIRPQQTGPGPGTALTETVARGITWAVDNGAQVINLSLAWPASIRSRRVDEAIAHAESRGVIIVSSAGNDRTIANVYPCIYASVVCVGAHGPDGAPAYFSNHGPMVDLYAPGLSILSSWPMTRSPTAFAGQIGYEFRNGTSMAAPFVAGALAELRARGFGAAESRFRLLHSLRSGRNLDLTRALATTPAPDFARAAKAPVDLVWNGTDSYLTLNLEWVNRGTRAGPLEIEFRGRPWRWASVAPGESRTISFPLSVDATTESQLLLETRVNGQPQPVLALIRRRIGAGPAPGAIREPIEGLRASPDAQVRSVVAADREARLDLVFLEAAGRDLRVRLVQGLRAAGETLIAGRSPEQLLNPYRLPDGSYALVFTSRDQDNRPIFDLLHFDPSLRPTRTVRIGTDVTILSENFRWARTDTGYNPLWISLGYTPKADQPAYDPWNPKYTDSKKLRVYLVRDGQIRALALRKDQIPLQVLPDSSVLVAQGDTWSVDYRRLRIEGGKILEEKPVTLREYQMLAGLGAAQTVIALDGSVAAPGDETVAFTAPSSPGQLRVTAIGAAPFDRVLTRDSVFEALVQVSGVFRTGSAPGAAAIFAQTHYDLRYFDASGAAPLSASLNRYSYIPSMIFNRSFFPLVAADETGRRSPAIYVAASVANAFVSEIWIADRAAGRIRRPAWLRLEAEGCSALGNFIAATRESPAELVFVCGDERLRVPVAAPVTARK